MKIPEGECGKAVKKAMRLLEHMDRTERGLRDRLNQEGFSQEATEKALEYVKSYGYINDERYARNYIAFRIHSSSRQKIIQNLIRKGIDRETADQAWEEESVLNDYDEQSLLKNTIEKKYSADSQLDEKEMRRLYGYLVRRGFQFSDIASVLEELNIRIEK
ncbi:MAG: regulatory protein RecX [Clostridia bacterium]|nr:regulatory protein RecX [Clostridia bacterium]MDY5554357.1 regulatory protein RecX [Blautia sp.]